MATGTWALGWADGDIVSGAEYAKGVGCVYDSTLGSGAANIDVTSIVGSYAHMLIVAYLRSDAAAQGVDLLVRFNGDSGSSYGYSTVGDSGSGAAVARSITGTYIGTSGQQPVAGASATAGGFSPVSILVPHYAGSANHKGAEFHVGQGSASSAGNVASWHGHGSWRNTAAITRVTVSCSSGNIVTGSRLSIYLMGS